MKTTWAFLLEEYTKNQMKLNLLIKKQARNTRSKKAIVKALDQVGLKPSTFGLTSLTLRVSNEQVKALFLPSYQSTEIQENFQETSFSIPASLEPFIELITTEQPFEFFTRISTLSKTKEFHNEIQNGKPQKKE
ncbi:MAG: hypothetical protein ACI9VN_003263 [Patescibacteria group bacterium]|jgi:hypothetical protein